MNNKQIWKNLTLLLTQICIAVVWAKTFGAATFCTPNCTISVLRVYLKPFCLGGKFGFDHPATSLSASHVEVTDWFIIVARILAISLTSGANDVWFYLNRLMIIGNLNELAISGISLFKWTRSFLLEELISAWSASYIQHCQSNHSLFSPVPYTGSSSFKTKVSLPLSISDEFNDRLEKREITR